MKLKHLSIVILSLGLAVMMSCKGKPKDADIQANVESALKATPGVTAAVTNGEVTLSGQVNNEEERTAAEAAAKSVKDVKGVANNITVTPPPPPPSAPMAITADDSLKTAVAAVLKDFPGINADIKDGVITVTGEATAAKWKILKMALDALKPKKVDASGLKIK